MKILLTHTNLETRDLIAEFLRKQAGHQLSFSLDLVDGSTLKIDGLLELLNRNYNFIITSLRLPHLLSVRMAEIAHLARINTRIILASGTSVDRKWLVPLFDQFYSLPEQLENLGRADWLLPYPERRKLPGEEHVDSAVHYLLKNAAYIAMGSHPDALMGHYRQLYPNPTKYSGKRLYNLADWNLKMPEHMTTRFCRISSEVHVDPLISMLTKRRFNSALEELQCLMAPSITRNRMATEMVFHSVEWVKNTLIARETVDRREALRNANEAVVLFPAIAGAAYKMAELVAR